MESQVKWSGLDLKNNKKSFKQGSGYIGFAILMDFSGSLEWKKGSNDIEEQNKEGTSWKLSSNPPVWSEVIKGEGARSVLS